MNKFSTYIRDFITPSETKYYNFNNDKPPTVQDYIENRFKDQLKWYEEHAKSSMIKYYACQVVIVFFGAIIPIINVLSPATDAYAIRLLSSFFGGTIIVATGLLQLTKAYENWINYRSTAEQLKQEYQLFALKAEHYSDEKTPNKDSKERLFIENVESLIRLEGKKYLSTHQYSETKAAEP
jgi:uncharacterized protein DUF4231